jgi:hypothetical protein
MSWHKILLPHESAIEQQGQIINLFIQTCARNPNVKPASLFADLDVGDPYAMYFSPAAATICSDIIARYSGVPCEAPSGAAVKLMAGHAAGWKLLAT